ncbi:hypothetical protein [Hymenobacter sp. APR13]|uniref:hypothetical protein n=1 Tax=Hymenobacter sp. APR13 TaxID=1356852 RepID=UPI0004E056F7|nr:hypothetical protein [Hymenobacter sp. APR13]AII50838.1 hypothetical protein N008_02430 [Hymenobacter sp. APR13]
MSRAALPQQAGRWYAACLYAAGPGWAVVRDVARPGTMPGGPGLYQMQAGPGRFITQEAATAYAEALNLPPEPSRWDDIHPADWDEYEDDDEYPPHPWDLQ